MKTTFLSFLFVFAGLTISRGQDTGTKYSGRADVPGLGIVTFPAGDWFLEFRRPPPTPNPAGRPDYFGFRKVADTPERLGFRRYDPASAPDQLVHCLDGITEELGEGAPVEELKVPIPVGESFPMRVVPPLSFIKPTTGDIAFSFIRVRDHAPNWLCHAHLFSRGGWAFVVFHASPSVTNPDTVRDVTWISRPPAKPSILGETK
ncbi:MAG: hypothetical protein ABIP85_04720 [Chthoniobacteraceae bacterium]